MPTHLERARDVLRTLVVPEGIRASADPRANYAAIFTRDAMISGLVGHLAGEEKLRAGWKATLETLRSVQGSEGQIPSNYHTAMGDVLRVSWGTLTPKLDAVSWYILGASCAVDARIVRAEDFRDSVSRAIRVLQALEYTGKHLFSVPAGGNWADEWPYEGYILFDQVLRAWALRTAGRVFGESAWTQKAEAIAEAIAQHYWPEGEVLGPPHTMHVPAIRTHVRHDRWHPIGSFSPARVYDAFDGAAYALLLASGTVESWESRLLGLLQHHFLRRNALPPAFHPVVHPGDPMWDEVSRYHLFAFRNYPNHYHNGGIWPVWLGITALGLKRVGAMQELAHLQTLFRSALTPRWSFEEYLQGDTLTPHGTPWMGYSASGYLAVFLESLSLPEVLV